MDLSSKEGSWKGKRPRGGAVRWAPSARVARIEVLVCKKGACSWLGGRQGVQRARVPAVATRQAACSWIGEARLWARRASPRGPGRS